ncbi:MAG: universal stress protein [Syntrophales bacterium]|nr:universal stress protein [Syntrophales bacterium]MCK9528537.1 universal stress protein [Syntrophales bacterium]MDX9922836.1 universal stress protein [Syntrophales bacterium]
MNIVVAYRHSKQSEKMVEKAIEHARTFNGTIYLVTSLEGGSKDSADTVHSARDALDRARERIEKEGIPCEVSLLVRGLSPGEDIVEYARQKKADEIIVGVQKKSKVGKFLMGSTAQHVILNAGCPVIAIKF